MSRSNDSIKLITHNGSFHADDLFACATLKILYPNASIARTRDEAIISTGDIVFDIGGKYELENNRFDHHQRGGAGVRDNGIPYAAFGLIWKHFGLEVCKDNTIIWERLERKIVMPLDAIDNGVAIVKDSTAGLMPYTADQVFLTFSPTWKESEVDIDDVFREQVEKVKIVIEREVTAAEADAEGETLILQAPRENGIVLMDRSLPRYLYQNVLVDITDVDFILLPQEKGTDWKVEGIRKARYTMEPRKPFPAAWAGLEGEALQQISGVATATFCHNGRFLAGAGNREDALKLAHIALNT